jgi:hypothetical protein
MPDKQVVDSLEYQLVRAKLEELKCLSVDEIKLSRHTLDMLIFRGLDKDLLLSCLREPDRLIKVDRQDEGKFKAWFKISGKYSLVAVLRFNKNNSINIITTYKTSRKWQKQIKPKVRRT